MSKHTSGPWHVDGLYIKDKCGCYVADIKLDDEDPEPLANARLIAAAPELLQALEHVVSGKSAYLNKVRAAIAKATGESA